MAKKTTEYEFYGAVDNDRLLKHRTAIGGSPNIAIPEGIETICTDAFEGEWCESVFIPSTVKLIGETAFNHCEALREIVISEGVEELGPWAFNACYALESIHIPASVVRIDRKKQPLNNCCGLREITVDENNPVFRAEGNCLIEKATGTVIAGCPTSVIPSDGSIKAIGDGAFCRMFDLKKINIPSGVERIGRLAFYLCVSLAEVKLPDSVTVLDESAFERCERLKKINIDRVVSFGKSVFCGCEKLATDVVLSDDVKKLGARAFAETPITSVTFGHGMTYVEESVFRNCKALKSVVLPDGMTKIEKNAFINCEGLTRIELPPSMAYIGRSAFWGCSELKDVVLPPNVDYIASDAFEYCGEKVRVPRKISNPDYEMDGTELCKYRGKARDAVIPDGVTKIKPKAFRNKKSLTSVVIPASVTMIAASAFEGCESLVSITVDDGNVKYRSVGNCIVDIKNKTLVCGCIASVLPEDDIEKIGQNAFYKCKKLETAVIPHGVKKIGNKAFEQCEALKTVIFPEGLELVGDSAFCDCKSLEAAVFLRGLKLIDCYAFCRCVNLSTLIMPEGLETIQSEAFYGCKKLEVLDFPEGLKDIIYLAFRDCNNIRRISLPSTAVNIYNAGFDHNPKLESITVAEGNPEYSSEGNCLVCLKNGDLRVGCATSVIPDNGTVERIEDGSFTGCDIESVVIPKGATVMHSDAFKDCKKLKHLTLPPDFKQLWDAFKDSTSLETVTAPERYRKYFADINKNIKFTPND